MHAARLLLGFAVRSAIREARIRLISTVAWLLFIITAMFWLAVQAVNAAQNIIIFVGLVLSFAACRMRVLRVRPQIILGWPASLALASSTRFLIVWCQAAGPVMLLLSLTALLAWVMGANAQALALMLIASFIASIVAGRWSNASSAQRYPDSRYRRSRPEVEADMGLEPITNDLHAFVAFKMRPDELAKAVVPFLLLLPSQVSVTFFLMLGLLAPALLYASFLMGALPEFFRFTRSWLCSTPVSFGALKHLIRRSLWPRFGLIGVFVAPMMIHSLGLNSGLFGMVLLVGVLVLWLEITLRLFLRCPV